MKKNFQLCLLLLLSISIVLSAFAQNKVTKRNKWNFTEKDNAKINKVIFDFFEFDNPNLTEAPIYFEDAPAQFKKQLINKIKRVNKNVKIILLTDEKMNIESQIEIVYGEAKLNFSSNQRIRQTTQKGFYYAIDFIKQTSKSVSISVAYYSTKYATEDIYTFEKDKQKPKRKFVFVTECGSGNCEGGVYWLRDKENQMKKKIIVEDDDPPPPFIKPPLKIIKPNE